MVLALAVAACSDKKSDSGAPPKGEVNEYIVQHAREDVPKITEKVASKTASLYDCVVIDELDQIQRADAALAAKIKQLCAYDVPMMLIEKAVTVAEPARKAAPDAITIDGCDIDAGMSVEELEKYGTLDARAAEMIKRLDAACPLLAETRADRKKRAAASPASTK